MQTNSDRQSAVHQAVARSFLHRFLAQAFADPNPDSWLWLTAPETWHALESAARTVDPDLAPDLAALHQTFQPDTLQPFLDAHLEVFGHAARGPCPLNEIEYGDPKADPLHQPHRLADLAAFYRAFGLELTDDAGERHDHISLELEFLCVLAAREAYALEHDHDPVQIEITRQAQKRFLREHAGRWIPAFTRRLAGVTDNPELRALAVVTRRFLELECARFGVPPGNDDLLLRPVDSAAEQMCASCELAQLPPGATNPA